MTTTRRACSRWLPAVLVLLAVGSAWADTLTLKDGSRLIGTIQSMSDGKLILDTDFAGTITIDAGLVTAITTDTPLGVGLDTGDRLIGQIEWRGELNKGVVQTALGGVPVDVERIVSLWPKDGKNPEQVALEKQLEEERAKLKEREGSWSLTFEGGLLYTDGNTNIFNANGAGVLQKKSAVDLLKFYVRGVYREEDQVRSSAEIVGGAYYEHLLLGNRFFGYASTEFEYDEFENLDLRASFNFGAGYYWIKKKTHEFKTRAGLGYLHETYMDDTRRDDAQAELGLDYMIELAPWLKFVQAANYYPTFNEVGDYRLFSDTAFIIPLGKSDMWKLKLGAQYKYKSRPVGTAEALDQMYYANLLLDLK